MGIVDHYRLVGVLEKTYYHRQGINGTGYFNSSLFIGPVNDSGSRFNAELPGSI